ncbi:MAG: rod shape-determining protein RodA [Candidatus Sungbacteria bacterium RIFCSPLOWO2_02_FULL_51_17]|uniref:Rod shape-determining protein RodA n=1 Tax=Candidatus Sungbacteria bacterium RIFCSPHIGHO2_02_FULL_51_29 TaxID=1802273 RepID=A0A1G2KVG2_9BACT|nr:MAG: rod shape-determining protein RodA [Candidatus Sungbacteria bacterium RIFCSPHIGHO2_01_FULL_51_22]OHA03428.1 MAG: rod shape-determining protein RodA [Candidatus Sungbacteria bacterium RIFCSPHIGHO2_02_FULL_51_29]OHA07903.1 MAG: rod shape-determining protein RodA [Candidatus Sungbacteria bacterium RIFCSPLOWO2_01_FULL_51_34]OHA12457.1 MAG: rod shape-determining protein RodA [Candidatus Sungbacteria bacterium RIFCSPLOWO2_02_FULL_51_17]
MMCVGIPIRQLDQVLTVTLLLIVLLSMITLWSVSDEQQLFQRQAIWVGVGVVVFFIFSFLDYRVFRNHGGMLLALFAITLVALAALLLFGPRTRGIAGWFYIQRFGIQPVEPLKLVLVLLLAKYFSKRHVEIYQLRHIIISGAYAAVPALLVLLQPDLGSAIIIASIWLAITLCSGIRLQHFAMLMGVLAVVAVIGWVFMLHPYQKLRITSFLNPGYDPQGAGYNTRQALIAVGSGEVFGKGIGGGSQSHLQFLPEVETDFIFAAFAEEWGYVGALFLLLLFGVLLGRILSIGRRSTQNFAKLYVLGFSALLLSQIVVHIGMNIGLLPVTGITLPFMSYGGSSFVTLMMGMGIVQSIKMYSTSSPLSGYKR